MGGVLACGLTTAGVAWCGAPGATPVGVSQMETGTLLSVQVSNGGTHACALAENRQVYCWGDNRFGEVGDGTIVPRSSPTLVVGLP